MMKYLFAFLFLLITLQTFSQLSEIKGKVEGRVSQEKMTGAFVSCTGNGHTYNTTTDADGEFKFRNIPMGSYDIKIEYVGFNSFHAHVELANNKKVELKIQLDGSSKTLSAVQVYGKLSQEDEIGAIQKEKHSPNIVNVISAQAMERSPDINAANVLQRMSGLTIQRNGGADEAYPIIRGLDPRYNNTLINGIKITSPDDKSRYVPLNIVPSDLLGSIEVSKTLTPEMEGDAIGGSVNLVMKDAPNRETFRVLGSLGYSAIFFNQKFATFSKSDIQQKSVIEKYGSSYTAQPNDFSRSNLDFKEFQPGPNSVATVVYGNRYFNKKLGLMAAGSFQNQYYGSNSVFNQVAPDIHANGAPTISDYANRTFSTQQLNAGLTVHLDYAFNDRNKITLTNILLYTDIAQARLIIDTSILGGNGGRTVPGTGPVSTDYTSVTSMQLLENIKLDGKHILSKHFLFDWVGVYSYAAKRVPDYADLSLNKKIDTVHTNNDIHGPYSFVVTPDYFDAITRIWQHNQDIDLSGMANFSYRTALSDNKSLEIRMGGLYRHKIRYNIQDEYDLKPTTTSAGIKQQFTDIYTAQWIVYNSSGTYDYDKNKYQVFENVGAGYAEAKYSSNFLDAVGGVRIENTEQGFTLNSLYATGINGIDKKYTDVLPSIDLKFKLNPKTNLRATYYAAVSRPNYYDLVPGQRLSTTSANTTEGNPYLLHTTSNNYDIRYEFYPNEDEQIFAGVFYKKLFNPIEFEYKSGTDYQPVNTPEATDYGFELAFTKYFGTWFGITGNYTYLNSSTSSVKSYYDIPNNYINTDTLEKRALQGQTDHTLNISLLYRNKKNNLFAELAFQYIGRSIGLVYPIYGYDYYQQPQANLAFSAEKGLGNRHFTVFTKWNNLLNTQYKYQINNILVSRETTQFNFSFGIRYEN
jgi:outer membrane receptor protein involved in Fe transport